MGLFGMKGFAFIIVEFLAWNGKRLDRSVSFRNTRKREEFCSFPGQRRHGSAVK